MTSIPPLRTLCQAIQANIDSLYDFFKNVRGSVENSDISLTKLDYNDIEALIVNSEQGNTTMSFEISNPKNSSRINMNAAQTGAKKDGEKDDKNGNNEENTVDPPKLEPLDPPTN